MTTTLNATPVEPDDHLTVPADTELVDSASVILYAQKILNNIKWHYDGLKAWIKGGLIQPADTVQVISPATKHIQINRFTSYQASSLLPDAISGPAGFAVLDGPAHFSGVTASAPFYGLIVDGAPGYFTQGSRSNARMRAPKGVTPGATVAGITQYGISLWDRVWNNLPVAAGCVWQIASRVDVDPGEEITFFHVGTGAVVIKDDAGTNLVTLQYTSGAVFKATISYDGANFNVVDWTIKP